MPMGIARRSLAALAAALSTTLAMAESTDPRYMEVCVQKRADRRAHYIAECARPLHQAGNFNALDQCARRIDALCEPGATDRQNTEERDAKLPTYHVDLSRPEPPAFRGETGSYNKPGPKPNQGGNTALATFPRQTFETVLGEPTGGTANRPGERRTPGSPGEGGGAAGKGGAIPQGQNPSTAAPPGQVVNANTCVETYDFVVGYNSPKTGANGVYKIRNKCNYRINAATCVADIYGAHDCSEEMLGANTAGYRANFAYAALRGENLVVTWYACRDDERVFCPRSVREFTRQKESGSPFASRR